MVTEERTLTDAISSIHENAELPKGSFMADCLDDCIDVLAEALDNEHFNVEMIKQNRAMSVATIQLQISGECSKVFRKRFFHLRYSSV